MSLLVFLLFSRAQCLEVTASNIKGLLEAKNARVSSSKLEKEAAGERQGVLRRSFAPTLVVYGGQESFKIGRNGQKTQPVYGAEVSVNLLNAGRDKMEDEVRSLEAVRRGAQVRRVVAEETEKARAAYWQLLYAREKVTLLKSALELNQDNLEAAKRRIRSGVAADSDRFEFEMKDVELRRELAEAEIEVTIQTKRIGVLLGTDDPLSFPEPLTHDHEYAAVLQQSPQDHLFKEHEIEAEQSALKASSHKRDWWPKIDVFAGLHQYNEREKEFAATEDRREVVAGVRATINLGFEARREAAALRKEAQAANTLVQYQKTELEAHLQGERAGLELLHNRVHEAEENITRAERYYKLTQAEYGRGVKNSPDVLGASEKLFAMKHKRLEMIRDFQVSKAHLLSVIGQ